jgi:hypothetical protein
MAPSVEKIKLQLDGMSDIMFDHFYGQEKDTRPPEQKLYLEPKTNKLVFPTENIYAFLFNENPPGCAKTEGKMGKDFIRIGLAHVIIDPDPFISFQRKGKDIIFEDFEDDDLLYVTEFSPRTRGPGGSSIKCNPKKRPALKVPWSLAFEVTIIKNDKINSEKIYNWFTKGGITIGLGTYRPRFGRFSTTVIP